MKIILLQDVKKVGKKNEIVECKDGYANFLITSGKAIKSSNKADSVLNQQLAKAKAEEDKAIAKANELKAKIETITLPFSLKTNGGVAFGSISSKQVLDKLEKEHGIKLDKFNLVDGMKTYGLGGHRVGIKLHKTVIAMLTLRVTGE